MQRRRRSRPSLCMQEERREREGEKYEVNN
jgi:hypothetical protein